MQLTKIITKIRPEKLAYYGVIGAVALVVGSFAVWQLMTLISPQINNSGCTGSNPAVCTTAILRVSDYSENNCPNGAVRLPLPNSIDDNTVPCLADNALNATTLLTGNTNNINLFRLQGQAVYK